jgi:hypothetical protein
MFEPVKGTRRLLCEIDEHEQARLLQQIMGPLRELDQIEDEKKEALAVFNGRKKAAELQVSEIRQAVERRAMEKDVEVELREQDLKIITVRLDTGAVVDVRPMTDEERQGNLIFDKADAEFSRDNQTLTDMLAMVEAEYGRHIELAEVEGWTGEQFREAERWAALTHMKASDNDGIEVPPMPDFLKSAATSAGDNVSAQPDERGAAGDGAASGEVSGATGSGDTGGADGAGAGDVASGEAGESAGVTGQPGPADQSEESAAAGAPEPSQAEIDAALASMANTETTATTEPPAPPAPVEQPKPKRAKRPTAAEKRAKAEADAAAKAAEAKPEESTPGPIDAETQVDVTAGGAGEGASETAGSQEGAGAGVIADAGPTVETEDANVLAENTSLLNDLTDAGLTMKYENVAALSDDEFRDADKWVKAVKRAARENKELPLVPEFLAGYATGGGDEQTANA